MSRPALLVAASLFLGAASACTSGGAPAASPSSSAQQAGAAAEPAQIANQPDTRRVAAIRRQLLGAGDVAGYSTAKGRSYEYAVDRPCLKPTMLSAFPQHERLTATLAGGPAGKVVGFVAEQVVVFGDEPTARAAYTANVAEFGCPGGILRDEDAALAVTIGVPQQVREVVGGDQATTWLLTSADKSERARVVVVVAQVADMVVDLAFSSDSEATAIANPLAVAKAAIAKLGKA
jgi:hypothetical protein